MLIELPHELILYISHMLDPKSLIIFNSTCKSINAVLKNDLCDMLFPYYKFYNCMYITPLNHRVFNKYIDKEIKKIPMEYMFKINESSNKAHVIVHKNNKTLTYCAYSNFPVICTLKSSITMNSIYYYDNLLIVIRDNDIILISYLCFQDYQSLDYDNFMINIDEKNCYIQKLNTDRKILKCYYIKNYDIILDFGDKLIKLSDFCDYKIISERIKSHKINFYINIDKILYDKKNKLNYILSTVGDIYKIDKKFDNPIKVMSNIRCMIDDGNNILFIKKMGHVVFYDSTQKRKINTKLNNVVYIHKLSKNKKYNNKYKIFYKNLSIKIFKCNKYLFDDIMI